MFLSVSPRSTGGSLERGDLQGRYGSKLGQKWSDLDRLESLTKVVWNDPKRCAEGVLDQLGSLTRCRGGLNV